MVFRMFYVAFNVFYYTMFQFLLKLGYVWDEVLKNTRTFHNTILGLKIEKRKTLTNLVISSALFSWGGVF